MPTQPFNLQDAIAAWLSTQQPAPAPEPAPDFRTVTTPADGLVDMAQPSQPKVDWRALALAAQGTVKAQADIAAMAQQAQMAQPTPWQNMGLRIAGGVGGGIVGSVGGPVGAAAGAALGSALMSNEVVQPREVQQGTRDGVSPLVGYAEGAANMLPMSALRAGQPFLGQLPRVAGSAAAGAGAGSVGVQLAETGTVDPMRTLQETALGTALGTAIPVGVRGVRAIADSPAVQRMMADETGAVGPRIKPATARNIESAYRMSSPEVRQTLVDGLDPQFLDVEGDGIPVPKFDALLAAAKAGDEGAVEALKILRLDPTKTPAVKTKAPTRVVTPVAESVQPELPAPPVADAPAAVAPEAARAPIGSAPEPDIRLSTGDAQPAAPSRVAEDIERHENRLRRLGQDEDAIAESTFYFRHVVDDPLAQRQREIPLKNDVVFERAKALLASGEFVPPTGPSSKMKFSEEDAAALAVEYATREEFLSRLNQRMGPNLRARFNQGDADAIQAVQELSAAYGVQGIDGLERLQYNAGMSALETAIADKAVGTAQGRGLQLRRARMSLKNVPDSEFIRLAREKGLPEPVAIKAAADIPDPKDRIVALRKLAKPTLQDKWRQVIYTALLSNPATHGVNFLGTTASIIAREGLSNTVVTGVDRVRSAVTGAPRQIANAPADMAGRAYLEGMKSGFGTAQFFLTRGYDPNSLSADVDVPLEAFTGPISGPVMQAPTRLLGAADAFMAQPVYWGEVFRRSTAKAMNEGLTGEALRARIEDLARNHEMDEELVKHVKSYVQTVLFKNPPGEGTRLAAQGVKWLNGVGQRHFGGAPLGTLLLPFLSTPAAIMRQGFKAAGGGLYTGAKAAAAGDSVQATRDVAEATIGLGLMAALVLNVADGTIGVEGDLPQNEFERESFYAQGKKPWSLKIGDRYIPATSLGPLATPIAIAGAYVQAVKADPKRPMDGFARYVAPALKMISDSTMLKGMSDFLEGVRDQNKADQLVGKIVTMNIPYAGALRYVRDQVDPILRDPGGKGANARFLQEEPTTLGGRVQAGLRNVQEEVEATLPGLSTRIRPRFDSFGQPVQRPDSMDRITGSQALPDPVRQEVIRLKQAFPSWDDDALYPGNMDAALTSLEGTYKKQANSEAFMFTERERNLYKVLVGNMVGETLTAVVNHPDYAALTDEEKADVIRNERQRAAKVGIAIFKKTIDPMVAARLQGGSPR